MDSVGEGACLREQERTRALLACDQSAQPRTAKIPHMLDAATDDAGGASFGGG